MKAKIRTSIKVVTGVKAGGMNVNHNRGIMGITVKSSVKAGTAIFGRNHSRRLASIRS